MINNKNSYGGGIAAKSWGSRGSSALPEIISNRIENVGKNRKFSEFEKTGAIFS